MRRQQRQQLNAFIERTQHGRGGKRTTSALGPPDPLRPFSPQRHGLTPAQCILANELLRRAEQERPLRGDSQQVRFRHALRCAGILSAIKRNLVGNSQFGRHLQGFHGGNIMKAHGMHILREIGPIGSLTAKMNREKRRAQEVWERIGEVIAPGERPTRSPEERRIRSLISQWEESEWRAQQDRLAW